MGLSDHIPTLIFALIVLAVIVFLIMGAYVVGPLARLKKGERIIVGIGVVGIGGVIVYAASELLLRVVF